MMMMHDDDDKAHMGTLARPLSVYCLALRAVVGRLHCAIPAWPPFSFPFPLVVDLSVSPSSSCPPPLLPRCSRGVGWGVQPAFSLTTSEDMDWMNGWTLCCAVLCVRGCGV